MLERLEGGHDACSLAGREGDLVFAERSKVLTEAVDLGDGEGDTTTAVGHLPGRGGGEERREEGRGGEEKGGGGRRGEEGRREGECTYTHV